MKRTCKEHLGGSGLDDLAEVHDHYPVGDCPYNAQMVGDEKVGEVILSLQLQKYVERLGLHRHIERAGGLIKDDEIRT